jgi:flagellar hook-basal body complex protein FliE
MAPEAPAAGSVRHVELSQRIEQARALATEARDAVDAVRAGGRGDVEGVLRATRQADAAFRMVQAVCNEMLETYAQMERTRA